MDPIWIMLAGVAVVVGGILGMRLHPFLALILGAFLVAGLTPADHLLRYAHEKGMTAKETEKFAAQSLAERVAKEFGNTCGKIGILIAMAAIIGKCLLESGAADRLVRSALRLLGERRAGLAFVGSAFVLGVPVFFDTVFYLMIPLAKSLAVRTGRNFCLYVLCIIAGATMAHSLVPPTPGPLFVASELKVDLGLMILGGMGVGGFAAAVGFLYAHWANRRWSVPLRETGPRSLEDLETVSRRPDSELPPLWISLLPIVLPVVLIAGGTIFKLILGNASVIEMPPFWGTLGGLVQKAGNPNVALVLAALVALALARFGRRSRRGGFPAEGPDEAESRRTQIPRALSEAGLIILITSAGGALGGVLQQCGVGWRIQELASAFHMAVLPLAFVVTALVRTAQGSATVAMITAVGIVGGMAGPEQLGFHPVYLALAIGCGSKPFPWMNDSGFWVIKQMSGFTLPETLRTFSCMLTMMGVSGLVVVMVLAWVFPGV